jgi:hypothetical protein
LHLSPAGDKLHYLAMKDGELLLVEEAIGE